MSRAQSSVLESRTPRWIWSPEARLILRPADTYRTLAVQGAERSSAATWHWLSRPVFLALMLGAFVSFTTAGRLTARLVFIEATFWSAVPLLQIVAASSALKIAGRRNGWGHDLNLFFLGNSVWHLWVLGISGLCLILGPFRDPLWPIDRFVLLGLFAVTLIWANRVRFAFYHHALRLPVRRAVAAWAVYNAVFWGVIVAYGAMSGQLLPRLARYWSF